MPIRQQIFALIVGIAISIFIVEMVRRKKLREEYSWLWLLTSLGIIVLVIWYDLLVFITDMIGAVLPTTTLFVFGLLFLLLIALHYSVKISSLTDQVRKLAQKIAHLRIFEDENGKMNLSLMNIGGEALVVPQFTLYADTRRGNRPSFTDAAPPKIAEPLVDYFVSCLDELGLSTSRGKFGAHMLVEIHNDGPVTILLDSRDKF